MSSLRRRVDAWRETFRASRLGEAVSVIGGAWSSHQVSRNVAAVTFYGLLSLFPLLYVFQFAIDLVGEVSTDLADSLGEALSDDLAVLGESAMEVDDGRGVAAGDVVAAVFGLPLALWGATRAFSTLFGANDEIWDVPNEERITGARRRTASIVGLVVFAVRVLVVAGAAIGAAVGFAALQLWGAVLARQWSSDATSTHAATVGLLTVMWGHVLVLQVSASLTAMRQVLKERRLSA